MKLWIAYYALFLMAQDSPIAWKEILLPSLKQNNKEINAPQPVLYRMKKDILYLVLML